MFNRFEERYLCTLYRMAKHGLRMGAYTNIGETYKVKSGATSIDPLALMLEGTRCTGHLYRDFSYEFAIAPGAMEAFKMFVVGRYASSNWSRENPVDACHLKNFGHGICHLNRGDFDNALYMLDLVPDLVFNKNIKKLTIDSVKRKVMPRGLSIADAYRQLSVATRNAV